MIALPRHKTRFWGQDYMCRPMLVSHIFGDGAELMTFEYMDDRPYYYVVLVPTGTYKEIDARSQVIHDLIDDIQDVIETEAMEFYSDRAYNEYERKGYVLNNRRWPIPPHQPCGCSWGRYSPSKQDLAIINQHRDSQRKAA